MVDEKKDRGANCETEYNVNIKHVRDGKVLSEETVHNLLVSAGREFIKSHIHNSGSPAVMNYIAIGEGTTGAAAGDTTLGSEAMRQQGTYTSGATGVCTIVKTFTIDDTYAITESGLLNAASSGTLLCRVVFTAKNVILNDQLTVTWTCTYSTV